MGVNRKKSQQGHQYHRHLLHGSESLSTLVSLLKFPTSWCCSTPIFEAILWALITIQQFNSISGILDTSASSRRWHEIQTTGRSWQTQGFTWDDSRRCYERDKLYSQRLAVLKRYSWHHLDSTSTNTNTTRTRDLDFPDWQKMHTHGRAASAKPCEANEIEVAIRWWGGGWGPDKGFKHKN